MKRALVTGGSGFLGSLMTKRLTDDGWQVVSIDLEPDTQTLPGLTSIQGDIRSRDLMEQIAQRPELVAAGRYRDWAGDTQMFEVRIKNSEFRKTQN